MNTTHHPRPSRTRLLQRAAAAAVVLGGAGALMLSASGVALASGLDQTSPQWAEIGPWGYTGGQTSQVTAVYTIQNVAEANNGQGTEMLEDHGNSMNSGGTVDVWTRWDQTTNQDPMGTGPYGLITQANYLWEFVPSNPSLGTTITQNYGELINRQSGLCLDVANNNAGDGATTDQWTCNGGMNQQWTAIPANGSYYLMPALDIAQLTEPGAGTPSLGIGNGSTCTTSGDGDPVYTRTAGTTGNPCDEWNIQQASYDFASYPLPVSETTSGTDNRGYECVSGDTLRTGHGYYAAGASNYIYRVNQWDFRNIGDPGVEVSEEVLLAASYPNYVPNGTIQYSATSQLTGQVMFYCDPPTTTP